MLEETYILKCLLIPIITVGGLMTSLSDRLKNKCLSLSRNKKAEAEAETTFKS